MKLLRKEICFILLVAVSALEVVYANSDADTVMMTMTSNKFGTLKINLRGSGP